MLVETQTTHCADWSVSNETMTGCLFTCSLKKSGLLDKVLVCDAGYKRGIINREKIFHENNGVGYKKMGYNMVTTVSFSKTWERGRDG